MRALVEFACEVDARQYRQEHNTGGWIFAPEDCGKVILFPPEMPPSQIFNHPITRGRSGLLIGSN